MAFLETPVCATCGYHYHTGVEAIAAEAADPGDDEFNKTQLFMMSPVFAPRTDAPQEPLPVGPEAVGARGGLSKKQIYACVAGIVAVLAILLWLGHNALVTPPAHPDAVVGRWARASNRGTVGLMFAADGSGALFWQPAAPGVTAKAGNVPLRWHQTPDGTLRIYPAQPAGGTDAQQAVDLLSSQAWPWNADARRLTLGKLSFARQGS